ncbi:MAG TPA: prepilin-type N-terminal cleavage/methylation domain-containing protein [Thermoanaerobaculia bacterium]|jgi:prepilin-type N-terminal cleavage/methylation domain-containing protein|nr:prepilin-type N-terminal cleavage/methylation domain-containing protein [Thermoanaerobaculia bacterium]
MSKVERKRRSEGGFNLIEVIVAMALMAVVVVSIMGLFVAGRRNVYSGKQMTQAVAVANRVMETMSGLDKPGVVAAFGLPATGTGASVSVNGVTYANSFLRTTSNITAANDVSGYLTTWRNDIVNNKRFSNPEVSVIITPAGDSTNTPAHIDTGTLLRIRTVVTWREGTRRRNVTLDSVKVFR